MSRSLKLHENYILHVCIYGNLCRFSVRDIKASDKVELKGHDQC